MNNTKWDILQNETLTKFIAAVYSISLKSGKAYIGQTSRNVYAQTTSVEINMNLAELSSNSIYTFLSNCLQCTEIKQQQENENSQKPLH